MQEDKRIIKDAAPIFSVGKHYAIPNPSRPVYNSINTTVSIMRMKVNKKNINLFHRTYKEIEAFIKIYFDFTVF